ncbi:MAG: GCN5-related N-acetyltransferase, partial [Polaromonas sp.]|nr:GCN5-related N-acetyltransferase [Polaromonas sp.]
LDDYLHRFAAQQSAKGVSRVYVLVDDAQPRLILGFYTLSAAQIDTLQLSEQDRKNCRATRCPAFAWVAWHAAPKARAGAWASC